MEEKNHLEIKVNGARKPRQRRISQELLTGEGIRRRGRQPARKKAVARSRLVGEARTRAHIPTGGGEGGWARGLPTGLGGSQREAAGGDTWHYATSLGGGAISSARDGRVRQRRERIFRVRDEMEPGLKWRGLFIEVEGARRVQMRCGFRPRDRDRTL